MTAVVKLSLTTNACRTTEMKTTISILIVGT
jgi:hypothetical protein